MAITNAHHLNWRGTDDVDYRCYVYTSPPSSHYIAFMSGGSTYYVNLSTSSAYYSRLRVVTGGSTYYPYPPQATFSSNCAIEGLQSASVTTGSVIFRFSSWSLSGGGFSSASSVRFKLLRRNSNGTGETVVFTSNSISISAGSTSWSGSTTNLGTTTLTSTFSYQWAVRTEFTAFGTVYGVTGSWSAPVASLSAPSNTMVIR